MKEYKKINVPRMVIKKVTCDRCGNDCTNTHMDILVRFSFSEDASLFETVCWKCHEENYKEKVMKIRNKKLDLINAKNEVGKQNNNQEKLSGDNMGCQIGRDDNSSIPVASKGSIASDMEDKPLTGASNLNKTQENKNGMD